MITGHAGPNHRPRESFPAMKYTPAKGHTSILSPRRQMRKHSAKLAPVLASGRQFKKFRKEAKRSGGFDFFKLPSFYGDNLR